MAKKDDKMGGGCGCCGGPWCLIGRIVTVLVAPVAFIWALNHLFGMALGYTVWSWFAALILLVLFTRKMGKCFCCNGCNCALGMMRK